MSKEKEHEATKKEPREREVFEEFGSSPDDRIFRASAKPFHLETCDGPTQIIRLGNLVRLKKETAVAAFYAGMVEPLDLPENYVVVHPHTIVGPDNLWLHLHPGDQVRLEREVAVKLLRKKIVKPQGREEIL